MFFIKWRKLIKDLYIKGKERKGRSKKERKAKGGKDQVALTGIIAGNRLHV